MNVVSLWEGNKELICIVALKLFKNNVTAVKISYLMKTAHFSTLQIRVRGVCVLSAEV